MSAQLGYFKLNLSSLKRESNDLNRVKPQQCVGTETRRGKPIKSTNGIDGQIPDFSLESLMGESDKTQILLHQVS